MREDTWIYTTVAYLGLVLFTLHLGNIGYLMVCIFTMADSDQ